MKPFDDVFIKINDLVANKGISLDYKNSKKLSDGKNSIIFKNDLAYELGGKDFGLGGYAITNNKLLINSDEVILIGNDLPNIKSDCNFARISLILVDDELSGENLFQKIRKIDYVRYHVNKEGYMVRISPTLLHEAVRVSKDLVKNKISFASIGSEYIAKYHDLPNVLAAKIIFITDNSFDYKSLNEFIIEQENITKALDHLVNKLNMDCNSCNLQKICASVEELCADLKK